MTIIECGHLPHKIERFKCNYCGTIFEADETEYETVVDHNKDYLEITCPLCSRRCIKSIY